MAGRSADDRATNSFGAELARLGEHVALGDPVRAVRRTPYSQSKARYGADSGPGSRYPRPFETFPVWGYIEGNESTLVAINDLGPP